MRAHAGMGIAGQARVKVAMCVHISVRACACLSTGMQSTGNGQSLAGRSRGTCKNKVCWRTGGTGHDRGSLSPKSPLPSASMLSTTLKYFHLLWELPVQLPVVLGLFFFSFFFKVVIL